MNFQSTYVSKQPDENGIIHYSNSENQVWEKLLTRQMPIVKTRAAKEYLQGLDKLQFTTDHIPQLAEINAILSASTGWRVKPVAALIPAEAFFDLLAHQQFPAATFIRVAEEIDYLQEPDIFHEYFGHCPLITVPAYANFLQQYGKLALHANEEDRQWLARLFWFTIEFGLIDQGQGPVCYGGGILSSKKETIYAVESDQPQRLPLGDGMVALRTPYRIDMLQPVYFVIQRYDQIYQILQHDILGMIHQAQDLGDLPAKFSIQHSPKTINC